MNCYIRYPLLLITLLHTIEQASCADCGYASSFTDIQWTASTDPMEIVIIYTETNRVATYNTHPFLTWTCVSGHDESGFHYALLTTEHTGAECQKEQVVGDGKVLVHISAVAGEDITDAEQCVALFAGDFTIKFFFDNTLQDSTSATSPFTDGTYFMQMIDAQETDLCTDDPESTFVAAGTTLTTQSCDDRNTYGNIYSSTITILASFLAEDIGEAEDGGNFLIISMTDDAGTVHYYACRYFIRDDGITMTYSHESALQISMWRQGFSYEMVGIDPGSGIDLEYTQLTFTKQGTCGFTRGFLGTWWQVTTESGSHLTITPTPDAVTLSEIIVSECASSHTVNGDFYTIRTVSTVGIVLSSCTKERILSTNIMTYKSKSTTETEASACVEFLNDENVLHFAVKDPYELDTVPTIDCPFAGAYQLTYNNGGEEECRGIWSSTVSVHDDTIDIQSCSSDATFTSPLSASMKCVATFPASEVGLDDASGNFLILTAPDDLGTPAYYVSRFSEADDGSVTMALSLNTRPSLEWIELATSESTGSIEGSPFLRFSLSTEFIQTTLADTTAFETTEAPSNVVVTAADMDSTTEREDTTDGMDDTTGAEDTTDDMDDTTGAEDTTDDMDDTTGAEDTTDGMDDTTGREDTTDGMDSITGSDDTTDDMDSTTQSEDNIGDMDSTTESQDTENDMHSTIGSEDNTDDMGSSGDMEMSTMSPREPVLCGFPTEFTEAIWWTATGAGDIGAATNTYTETTVTLTIGGVDAVSTCYDSLVEGDVVYTVRDNVILDSDPITSCYKETVVSSTLLSWSYLTDVTESTTAAECKTILDNTDRINAFVKAPFDLENVATIDCPFSRDYYILSYVETSDGGKQCGDGISSSLGQTADELTISSCTDSDLYATPFNTDLKCVDHFTADTIGLTGGDFLITTAPTDIGTPAYYISRFGVLDENTIQWAVAINDDVKMQWQIDLDFDAYGSDEIDFGTIIRFEATADLVRHLGFDLDGDYDAYSDDEITELEDSIRQQMADVAGIDPDRIELILSSARGSTISEGSINIEFFISPAGPGEVSAEEAAQRIQDALENGDLTFTDPDGNELPFIEDSFIDHDNVMTTASVDVRTTSDPTGPFGALEGAGHLVMKFLNSYSTHVMPNAVLFEGRLIAQFAAFAEAETSRFVNSVIQEGSIIYEGDVTEGDDPTAEEIIETIKDGLLDGALQLTAPDGTVLKIDPEYLAAYILSGHCTTKPCQNAGVCKDEPNNGANFTCVCTDKFKGYLCEEDDKFYLVVVIIVVCICAVLVILVLGVSICICNCKRDLGQSETKPKDTLTSKSLIGHSWSADYLKLNDV